MDVLQKSTATKLTRTTAAPCTTGIIAEPQSQATDRATCAHNAVATPAPSDSSNPPNDNTPSTTTHYAANPPTATSTSPTHIAPLALRSPIQFVGVHLNAWVIAGIDVAWRTVTIDRVRATLFAEAGSQRPQAEAWLALNQRKSAHDRPANE